MNLTGYFLEVGHTSTMYVQITLPNGRIITPSNLETSQVVSALLEEVVEEGSWRPVYDREELEFLHYLRMHFPEQMWHHNLRFGKEKPDIYLHRKTHSIIIEVDEHQHKSYGTKTKTREEAELLRMKRIQKEISRPCVFIRYNPDSYIPLEGEQKSIPERREVLREQIEYWIQIEPTNKLTVEYFFYDCTYSCPGGISKTGQKKVKLEEDFERDGKFESTAVLLEDDFVPPDISELYDSVFDPNIPHQMPEHVEPYNLTGFYSFPFGFTTNPCERNSIVMHGNRKERWEYFLSEEEKNKKYNRRDCFAMPNYLDTKEVYDRSKYLLGKGKDHIYYKNKDGVFAYKNKIYYLTLEKLISYLSLKVSAARIRKMSKYVSSVFPDVTFKTAYDMVEYWFPLSPGTVNWDVQPSIEGLLKLSYLDLQILARSMRISVDRKPRAYLFQRTLYLYSTYDLIRYVLRNSRITLDEAKTMTRKELIDIICS